MKKALLLVSALILALSMTAWADTRSGQNPYPETKDCLKCHKPITAEPTVHAALQMDGNACLNCHETKHHSDHSIHLNDKLPQLCMSCHDGLVKPGAAQHGALEMEGSCINCHSPHSTKEAKLLKKSTQTLCLDCHTEKGNQPFNAHAASGCTDCHSPHASVGFPHLLKGVFPETKHARYQEAPVNTYGLCLDCHGTDLLKPTVQNGETQFYKDESYLLSGKKRTNLHWLHVTQAKTGPSGNLSYTCAACHNVHGSDQPHMIRADALPGFTPLKFSPAPKGGTCAGACHTHVEYFRE